MADPRSALERLTQLRGPDPVGDYYPRVSDLRADALTLLSAVEQMRDALTDFTAARQLDAKGNGVAWYLGRLHEAWVKASAALPPAPQEEKPNGR